MAARGPKPKSAALKLLKGSRSDRLDKPRPPVPQGRPVCPDRFSEEARAEWNRLCDRLEAEGVLNPGHGFSLAIYCGSYERLLAAEEALREHGPLLIREQPVDKNGDQPDPVIKSNPASAVASRCEAQMQRILAEFGLTPQSAARASGPAEGPPDRFAEFLTRKPTK